MAELPLVVVQGAWIARVLVITCGVTAVLVGALLRRRAARRRLARERTARGKELRSLAAGATTIAGRLRGTAATAFGESGEVIRERSGELVLEVEGRRVELRGEVEVVAGTRVRTSWWHLPRGLVDASARGGWRALGVRDGDEVLATGLLSNVAGGEATDYREHAGVWVMEPQLTTPVIELFAARPRVSRSVVHPGRPAAVLALASAIAYVVLWGVGAALLRVPGIPDDQDRLYEIPVPGALAFATALPQTRGRALEKLAHRMEHEYAQTDHVVKMRFELAELTGGCSARAALELAEEHLGEAYETARACGDQEHEVSALMLLGRYKTALRVGPVTPDQRAITAIAVGDWAGAAVVAGELARAYPDDGRYTCLESWFRAQAGDTGGIAEHPHSFPVTCQITMALDQPGDARLELLRAAAASPDVTHFDAIQLAMDLAWAYGAPEDAFAYETGPSVELLLGDPGARHARPWLSTFAFASRHDPGVLAHHAVLEAIRDDLLAAGRDLEQACAAAPAHASELDSLRLALRLHAPEPVTPDPVAVYRGTLTGPLAELRAGELSRNPDGSPYGDRNLGPAVRASITGDGEPLARALLEHHPVWDGNAGALLAIAPRIHVHRAELAAALHGFHGDGTRLDRLPFDLVTEAAVRRDLARMVGDNPAALRWQAIIRGQRPLLDDPRKVVALLLWETGRRS